MQKNLEQCVKAEVETIYSEIVMHYRHFHQHPELSFQEKETAAYIESELTKNGIPFRNHIGGYGILAWIEGVEPDSKTIALRADMDALPIQEANNIAHRSQNDGVMHACGHDTHTASLLSAAKIIQKLRANIRGRILFIFQPGEERHPGGASLMLSDNIFDKFVPNIIVGQHAYIDYPPGKVGFQSGIIMASSDEVHIRITGRGGHGAIPNELNDTVLAASQVIVAMQQIVSRRSNPFKPMVLSFGKFIADGATNVIPDEVVLAGSLRCMDEEERAKMKPIIREVARATATANGCECHIEVYDGYPCTVNDEHVTTLMKGFAQSYLGKEMVAGLPQRMTSEDFGFFSQKYPSTFYRFGIKGQQATTGLHTPTFLIDEQALKTSTGLIAYLALKYCE